MPTIIGWDVGGVNTKAARLGEDGALQACVVPYELQVDPGRLSALLRETAAALAAGAGARHAVTMTAELSQMFRTKRDGVGFVLDAFESAFPARPLDIYGVDGCFHSTAGARARPLTVAASNWMATASVVAAEVPDGILLDVGTTTTDLIPLVGGRAVTVGRTDPERLASGELIYTGALRTPTEAVARRVPLGVGSASVSAEGFALMGDVYLWLGLLDADDYTVRAPDGRPATREFAGERLARVVCADRDMLADAAIDGIAHALADAQVGLIREGLAQSQARHPTLRVAVVTGLGDFIAARAARESGLEVVSLAQRLGRDAARAAPAAAVALLLRRTLGWSTW